MNKKPPLLAALVVLLATLPISVLVSLLDAWAIRLLCGWFTTLRPTVAEAFTLSLLTGMLCKQYISQKPEDAWANAMGGLAYSVVAPLMFAAIGYLAFICGLGVAS